MYISVVIPVYNGAAYLPGLLKSIWNGAHLPNEIIVVDDGSTDSTAAVVAGFTGVRYLRQPENRGPGVARNAGAALAQGEVLLFLDADVEVADDTIRLCAESMVDPENKVMMGNYSPHPLNKSRFAEYKAIHVNSFVSDDNYTDSLEGFCCAVRADLFRSVGGFNEKIKAASYEDYELGWRIMQVGEKMHICKAMQVRHHFPGFWQNTRLYFSRTKATICFSLRHRIPNANSNFFWPGLGALGAVLMLGAIPVLLFNLKMFILTFALGIILFASGSLRLLRALCREKGLGWTLLQLPQHYISYLSVGGGLIIGVMMYLTGQGEC